MNDSDNRSPAHLHTLNPSGAQLSGLALNESVKSLREERYRAYQQKLHTLARKLKYDYQSSSNVIEHNHHALRRII